VEVSKSGRLDLFYHFSLEDAPKHFLVIGGSETKGISQSWSCGTILVQLLRPTKSLTQPIMMFSFYWRFNILQLTLIPAESRLFTSQVVGSEYFST